MQEGMLVLDALWLRRWYKRRHLHLGLAVHECFGCPYDDQCRLQGHEYLLAKEFLLLRQFMVETTLELTQSRRHHAAQLGQDFLEQRRGDLVRRRRRWRWWRSVVLALLQQLLHSCDGLVMFC